MSDPVAGGREALNHWYGYPWYDAQTDGVRRVELSPPWNLDWLPDWSFQFPASLLQWLAWIAIGLLLAGAAYLLARAYLQRERRRGGAAEEEAAGAADHVESLPVPLARGRTDLLAEARRCYECGDYAQAIVYYFSYQLVQLDKRHLIRLGRGKTNRQYLREVGPSRGLHALLEQTMTAFEEVYFGRRALDRAGFESCWSRLEEFETLVQAAI